MIASGTRLGPYEITAKLGEGGMGEVWRATDSRLKREVAIKVLPQAFTEDKERLQRFEREAQLLAQLHHPHIASIFGLEESAGVRALVMELVEGEDLAARIARGPLPLDEALGIAKQIAEALEAAHEKGIVHRDLKPQNVKLSRDGQVKVLDFGLAKAMDSAPSAASPGDLARSPTLMQSPTLTAAGTQLGVILGTAAYMAPEQARGGVADKRADIWAFGVVLHEMLVGRSLFAGDTVSDTLAGVLKTDVDFNHLPPSTSSAVRRLLRRCLERNPKNRLHDIADARIVLEEVLSGKLVDPAATATAPALPAPRLAPWLLAAAALAAGLALGALGASWWSRRTAPTATPVALSRFEIQAPAKTALLGGLALSPDGRKLAFVARGEDGRPTLWVRMLDQLEARQLPGTFDARYPFWAPDGRRIGFFAERKLKWVDLLGGAPLEITTTPSVQDVRGAAWAADDTILFAPTFLGPLQRVAAAGGDVAPATHIGSQDDLGTHRFPSFLPDGRRFLFYASIGTGTEPGKILLGRLGSLDSKVLGPSFSAAVYASPGFLLYARGETLVAHAFDERKEELVGEPIPLGLPAGGSISISGLRSLAVSRDGTLVTRLDGRSATQMVWADRSGRELEPISDGHSSWNYAPRLSPDGRRMVVGSYRGGSKAGELWVHDLARNVSSRLSFGQGDDYLAVWLKPDGREILFQSNRKGGAAGLYRIDPDRPEHERPWILGDSIVGGSSSTPDGRRVLFERSDEDGRIGIWIRDLDGDAEPVRLSSTSSSEFNADLSPDGRWLAFASDSTRTPEVYVRRLDGAGGTVRISRDGGTQPRWRPDGRELFYLDAIGHLVGVPIGTGEPLRPGAAVVLFDARLEEASDRQYDVSPDGRRFLLNRSLVSDSTPIVVTLGWTALLERQRE
jgi:Tol biopolymer transport system component